MHILEPPKLEQLPYISPSTYTAADVCRARGAWTTLANRPQMPEHPAGLLGLCFHAVVERAAAGTLAFNSSEVLSAARKLFDSESRELYESAHPLLRAKFRAPDRMPGYYLCRERAAVAALEAFVPPARSRGNRSPLGSQQFRPATAERWLRSSDGLLVGRPDIIDAQRGKVIDYKTGRRAETEGISEAELRQLRLYAYLASENGISVSIGVIARANGRRLTVAISPIESRAEARRAEETRVDLNTAIRDGEGFNDLARPSGAGCRMCACMSFCERFWESAETSWADSCGVQLQGIIRAVAHSTLQGLRVASLCVEARGGTVPMGTYTIEQVPVDWLLAGAAELPRVGDAIRILDGRRPDPSAMIVRADRTATTIWSAERSTSGGLSD